MACCDCCIGVPPIRPPINVSEQSDTFKVSDMNLSNCNKINNPLLNYSNNCSSIADLISNIR